MKKLLLIAVAGILSMGLSAQESDTTYWKKGATVSLTFNQVSLTNWQAGGENSISGNAIFIGFLNYKKDRVIWENSLELGLGYNRQGGNTIKTDDRIDLNTSVGYELTDKWFLTGFGQFRTQFFDGFKSVEDTLSISTFMAPAYALAGLGLEYKPNDGFRMYYSPITAKLTIVNDQRLADLGAFGVEAATFDDMGNLLTAGENTWWQVGSYFNLTYSKENIVKNVNLRTRLDLYSNYIENPQNLDVNYDLLIVAKVNSWLSANFQFQAIYDDDIKIDGEGPKLQTRQLFGAGLTFSFE